MKRQDWPGPRDYAEAIVDPTSLSSLELRSGALSMGPGGLPKMYSGTFTTTFHFKTLRGEVAFRCYTRDHEDVQARYAAIGELLRYVKSDALCQTQYIPEAIRVGGTQWPGVVMEWAPGLALNVEVQRKVNDGDALLALAGSFRELVRSLEALGIAHADLQHGNILVSHGRLRLIDYDAMFLPAIAALPQAEHGHRNYQHPQRRNAPFDNRLDRFSALVIYTALVALSADRALWTRFNDGENMLFRAHDFTSNGNSALFRTLLESNATSGLAGILIAACERPVEEVPTLEEALRASAGTMPVGAIIPPPRPTLRRPSEAEPAAAAPGAMRPPIIPPQVTPPPVVPPVMPAQAERPPVRPFVAESAQPLPIFEPDQSNVAARKRPRATRARGLGGLMGLVGLVAIVAGLAIGFATAAFRHTAAPTLLAENSPARIATPSSKPAHVVATRVRATLVPRPRIAAIVTAVPIPKATPEPTAVATETPTDPPTVEPTAIPTPMPTVRPTARLAPKRIATSLVQGTWQIDEANRQVGSIVWSGNAVVTRGGTIVLNAHKAVVAGHMATPCERGTTLHAAITVGVAPQTVRYRETNCAGSSSLGEIHVSNFSPDAGSFIGSVWRDGDYLGNFTARKQ